MFSRRALFFCSIVSVVATALAGCSDPYAGRMEVSGAVTLQGQPLKEGLIMFVPLDNQETQGGAQILDGEYKIPRKSGLKPGKFLVRLTAGDGKTIAKEEAAAPGGSANIVSMDLIPEEWNVRSKHQVDIKSDGPNRFDFTIPNMNTIKRRR